jgi:hypothetical protein
MLLTLDINNIQYISLLSISKRLFNKFNNVFKMYYVCKYYLQIIENILIQDDHLLLDLIAIYRIYFSSKIYYNTIFEKWNKYKYGRKDIYSYLSNINSHNLIIYNIFNNYSYLIINYSQSRNIKYIPQFFKDTNNLINNIDVAYYYIKQHPTTIEYINSLSPNLHNLKNKDNFKLFCFALKYHITVYSKLKNKKQFTEDEYLEILKSNIETYKYIPKKEYKNPKIITYIILNSNNINNFKLFQNKSCKKQLIELNIHNSFNYIHLVLQYMFKFNDFSLIEDLKDNKSLQYYFNIIQPYISLNFDYNKTDHYNFIENFKEPINYDLMDNNIQQALKNILCDYKEDTWNLSVLYNLLQQHLISSYQIKSVSNLLYSKININILNNDWKNIIVRDCDLLYISVIKDILGTLYFPMFNKMKHNINLIKNLIK